MILYTWGQKLYVLFTKYYSFRPTKDVTLSYLICLIKDVTFPIFEKVLSHVNIKIIFSLSI